MVRVNPGPALDVCCQMSSHKALIFGATHTVSPSFPPSVPHAGRCLNVIAWGWTVHMAYRSAYREQLGGAEPLDPRGSLRRGCTAGTVSFGAPLYFASSARMDQLVLLAHQLCCMGQCSGGAELGLSLSPCLFSSSLEKARVKQLWFCANQNRNKGRKI